MYRLFRRMRDQRGYTLVELLGVGVVLMILGALAVPTVLGALNRTKVRSATDSLNKMRDAVIRYYADSSTLTSEPTYPVGTATVETQFTTLLNVQAIYWTTPSGSVINYTFVRYTGTASTLALCVRAKDTNGTYISTNQDGQIYTGSTAASTIGCT